MIRPKYYRERRRAVLHPEAPHMDKPEEWIHFPGIYVDVAHRGPKAIPKSLPVFFEELGKEDRVGYSTCNLDMSKIAGVWVKRAMFHIWVHRPTLRRLHMKQSDIYAAYAHWRIGRIILNHTYNVSGVGTIMSQTTKRIDSYKSDQNPEKW